jgi:DNA ligase (NAD+)
MFEEEKNLESSYLAGKPLISDYEYDQLNLPKYPSLIKSMKSVYNIDDFKTEFDKLGIGLKVIEPKLDGMTLLLEYKDGILIDAWSKGNYGVRNSVLKNILDIVPNILTEKLNIQVRGELVISKLKYMAISEQFSSIRSATCGAVLCKEPKFVSKRGVEFVAFSVINSGNDNVLTDKTNFVNYFNFVETIDCVELYEECKIEKYFNFIENSVFSCDGIVIKLNNYNLHIKLGSTNSEDRWLFALKPNKEVLSTEVLDIIYNVSKHGRNIPILKIKPLEFNKDSKIRVERVAGLTIPILMKKQIGIGSLISVEIRSIAIPCLDSVLNSITYIPPVNCISCSSILVDYDLCLNSDCPAMLSMKLTQILKGLGIKGVGINLAERLVKFGCKDFISILELSKNELSKILGDKKSLIFYNQLQSLDKTANNLILSYSLPGITKLIVDKLISFSIKNIFMLRQNLNNLNLGTKTTNTLRILLEKLPIKYDLYEFA